MPPTTMPPSDVESSFSGRLRVYLLGITIGLVMLGAMQAAKRSAQRKMNQQEMMERGSDRVGGDAAPSDGDTGSGG